MNIRFRTWSWLPPAAVLFAFGISAEEAWPELAACRALEVVAERAACYDRAYDARLHAPEEARFGAADLREREERAAERRGERLGELVAVVTEVRRHANGRRIMTLDNGQAWGERGVDEGFLVAVGDEIRIQPAALGSYLMITRSNRSTRVTRLR